jgi:putative cell wall-binding protein
MARPLVLLAMLLAAGAPAACGRSEQATGDKVGTPAIGIAKGSDPAEAPVLGPPVLFTKNTTRIAGADPVADAAGASLAAFPSQSTGSRPGVVALADAGDWHAVVAASVLAAAPVRAALLLSDGSSVPAATKVALARLKPPGAAAVGGAQLVRVGRSAARPSGLRTTDLGGRDAAGLARAVDAFQSAAAGGPSSDVLVVAADRPALAMPAAAWAAKSGDPVLFTARDRLPADTRRAIAARRAPRIFVLGGTGAVAAPVLAQLRRLGTVRRIGTDDPVTGAIALARLSDRGFGWGAVDPGHGYALARADRPADAAAGALLATHGQYAPLLLVRRAAPLDPAVESYLLDVQPGYTSDPVRAVYNHGWVLGDERALSAAAQARLDGLLEPQPVADQQPSEPRGSSSP